MKKEMLGPTVARIFSACARFTLLGITFLAQACVPENGLSFQRKPILTTTVVVSDVQITLGGPRGYCVGQRQRRDSMAGSFVVFGTCVGGDQSVGPMAKGLLIANVSANPELGKSGNVSAIQTQLRSTKGRKSLSNSGDAATVDILVSRIRNNVVYIYTRDTVEPLIPDTTNEQWRGFFVVKGRLVSVSMLNFIDNAASADEAFALIQEFSSKIRQLNTDSQ